MFCGGPEGSHEIVQSYSLCFVEGLRGTMRLCDRLVREFLTESEGNHEVM